MKAFAALASLLLLVSGISSLATHKRSHQSKHHHARALMQSRAECEWECTLEDGSEVPENFFETNKSFLIEIKGDANFFIYYNSETGTLAILNKAINIVVVFYGNSGVFAAINTQSGSGLLFNIKSGYALYVQIGASVTSNSENIVQLAIVVGNYIQANVSKMTSLTLFLNSNAFKFSVNWKLALALKAELRAKVEADLGALLSVVASRYGLLSGIFAASKYGALVIILGISGTSENVQSAFLSVTAHFAFSAQGFLKANAALMFRAYLTVAASIAALVAGTVKTIAIAASGAIQLLNAAGAIVAEVTVTGAVVVAGAVVGVIGGALKAAGSFLGAISGAFSFSFGFAAGGGISIG